MVFKSEGKKMYPIFVFAKCCWSIHSKVAMYTADKATPTQTLPSHVKFMWPACPTSSASI